MRTQEKQHWTDVVAEYSDERGLAGVIEDIKAVALPQDGTADAIRRWYNDGGLVCYNEDVIGELADYYGGSFKREKYYTKSGEIRYNNGEAVAWRVLRDKVVMALMDYMEVYNEHHQLV